MQRMLKRGVETLRMEDYQVLYCEPGLATGEELERLKIMSSSEYFVRPCPCPLAAAAKAVRRDSQLDIQCLKEGSSTLVTML